MSDENELWWDNLEFAFFESLSVKDKIVYMYDTYIGGDEIGDMYDEYEEGELTDEEAEQFIELSDRLDKKDTVAVTENRDQIIIVASDNTIITKIVDRIFMNGVILKLSEMERINSKIKSTYSIIGVSNFISVN
jgi:hypothetical protein